MQTQLWRPTRVRPPSINQCARIQSFRPRPFLWSFSLSLFFFNNKMHLNYSLIKLCLCMWVFIFSFSFSLSLPLLVFVSLIYFLLPACNSCPRLMGFIFRLLSPFLGSLIFSAHSSSERRPFEPYFFWTAIRIV